LGKTRGLELKGLEGLGRDLAVHGAGAEEAQRRRRSSGTELESQLELVGLSYHHRHHQHFLGVHIGDAAVRAAPHVLTYYRTRTAKVKEIRN